MLLRGKKGKIILLISLLLIISGVIAFALIHVFYNYRYHEKMQISDLNGDDKSLSQITDEMIEENSYDQEYYVLHRKVVAKGSRSSSGITGKLSDKDYPYIYTDFGKISGIYIGNAYLGAGKEVTFSVDSTVSSGNLKIVLTNSDGKILYVIPIDSKESLTFFAETDEVYYLKYVAESAKATISVKRSE